MPPFQGWDLLAGETQGVALSWLVCAPLVFRGKKGEEKEPIERTAGVKAVQRLFSELGARYKDRNGGYTRIIKVGRRVGDNAELAVIELVDNPRELAAKG